MDRSVALQRVSRGRPATLSFTLLDTNGEPGDAAGTVTVEVDKADGTNVVPAGTSAPHSGASGSGVYTVSLTAAQTATLELLTATWTDVAAGTTVQTTHDIVGGFYFSVADARASDPVLANATKFPDQLIRDARREIEDEAERIIGAAFVPRYRRLALDGTGTADLTALDPVLRTVRSVRLYSTPTAYVAFTSTQLAALVLTDEGKITRNDLNVFDDGLANVVIEYEHGLDRPPPDLKRASLVRLRHRLGDSFSTIPDRATAVTTDDGTFALGTATSEKTGLPEVDAVYGFYADRYGGRGSDGPVSHTFDYDPSRLSIFHGGRR